MNRRVRVLLARSVLELSQIVPRDVGASLEGFLERACLRYGL
jgi:hypothetical protein